MATLYGTQYTNAYVDVPKTKIHSGDSSGAVMHMHFDYPIPGTVPTASDVIKLGKLPKGARILDAGLSFPDLGTTGVLELGWAASAELDSAGSAVEAADDNGFLVSVDVNAAAIACINMVPKTGAAVPGFMKRFAAEVDVQILVTTTWTSTTTTDSIKGYILYTVY